MRVIYKRKVSESEEKGHFLFILKDKLSFFPPIGARFIMKYSGRNHAAHIEAIPCNCVGTTHHHYHLVSPAMKDIRKDTIMTVEKKGEYYLMT